jgi:2-succinyl-5-enolpyruvyl-6-hydroxy-3-cyclohexene-1-carboxylate synthase
MVPGRHAGSGRSGHNRQRDHDAWLPPVNPSTALATVLVDELIACGVRDAVLCPGSRNAPLAMALHAADAAGRLRLHVRIDERTAAFLAVGLARSGGTPVPVATTSGTAVANLHPAVLEAHHGGVGLIVLSADRPAGLRDVGANQVIDQSVVFGGVLRLQHEFDLPQSIAGQNARWRSMTARAVAAASGAAGRPGPVQLNLPLAEPLLPDGDGTAPDGAGGAVDWPEPLTGRGGPWTAIPVSRDPTWSIAAPQPGERCLFLADLTWPGAGEIAAAGHPVVSEAGGLAGSRVLAAGIHLLADPGFLHAHRPDRVIVLGRPTLFRPVTALLGLPGVAVDVVDAATGYADVTGTARAVAPALAAATGPGPQDWYAAWRSADASAARAVSAVLGHHDVAASPVLARTLGSALAPGSTLVLGSSQTPRDIGMFTRPRDGVRVLANRGVAGIDGTVSTAVGAALASQGPTAALMGDLAFLHDLTGLAIGPHEPRPDLTIVVANNDGGGIFGTLEPGEPAHAHAFERVFGTPVGAELAPIVEGLGAEHLMAVTGDEVADALREPVTGIRVLEVPVTRTDLRALLAEVRDAVREALAGG